MIYKIVRSGEMKRLEKKVNKHIRKGWQVIGGVSVCGGYGHAHFHQAMKRMETEEGDKEEE